MSLANIDPRILDALRAIRSGAWSYSRHQATPHDLVSSLSSSLGYPASWGDVSRLPAVGGPTADAAWKVLRVKGRAGVGGIPCELVHGGVTGSSCTANAGIRGIQAFIEALAIYLPVRPPHFHLLASLTSSVLGPRPSHTHYPPSLTSAGAYIGHRGTFNRSQCSFPVHFRVLYLVRSVLH